MAKKSKSKLHDEMIKKVFEEQGIREGNKIMDVIKSMITNENDVGFDLGLTIGDTSYRLAGHKYNLPDGNLHIDIDVRAVSGYITLVQEKLK